MEFHSRAPASPGANLPSALLKEAGDHAALSLTIYPENPTLQLIAARTCLSQGNFRLAVEHVYRALYYQSIADRQQSHTFHLDSAAPFGPDLIAASASLLSESAFRLVRDPAKSFERPAVARIVVAAARLLASWRDFSPAGFTQRYSGPGRVFPDNTIYAAPLFIEYLRSLASVNPTAHSEVRRHWTGILCTARADILEREFRRDFQDPLANLLDSEHALFLRRSGELARVCSPKGLLAVWCG